ncbi:hypothetical protein ACFL1E_00605 [Candidatus Omnitrophota bacterium]
MNTCPFAEALRCSGTEICLTCKTGAVICIALIGGVIGYIIGRKKR